MNIDQAVLLFAGTLNLLGLALAFVLGPVWLILPVLVGVVLVQSAFTGFCPAAIVLKKLGFKPGAAFPSREK